MSFCVTFLVGKFKIAGLKAQLAELRHFGQTRIQTRTRAQTQTQNTTVPELELEKS